MSGALLVYTDRTNVVADWLCNCMLHLYHPCPVLLLCTQAFFIKWWGERSESARSRVRSLVASGQLQFLNGGVVQHDEATSHYSSIVDQMSAGMR
jgi:hypothetical protein